MQAVRTGEQAGRIVVIALVVVVTAVVGTVGVWGAISSDGAGADNVELADAISQVLFGTAFVLGGLVAWWSRPDNNTGRLMAGTGILFAAGSWQTVDDGWLLIAGALASLAAVATFLHLILAFPAGRIVHGPDRWVVGVAYAVVVGVALAVPFVQPNQADCDGCADNPLAAAPNETVTTIVIGLANVAIGLCVIALLVLSWRRFRRATPALRRTMAPLVGTASLAGVLFLVGLTVSLGPEWLQLAVGICFVTVMTLVPVAFLIGLLRDRLQRTSSIQGLVIRLAGAADHEQLRSILAEALRDPDLTIAFWFPERQTYVDPHGHPVDVPERGVTVVERDGEPIARCSTTRRWTRTRSCWDRRRRGRHRARAGAPGGGAARAPGRAAGLAGAHRRDGLPRAPPAGAGPARRRAAAARRPRADAAHDPRPRGEDESTVSLVEGASTELAGPGGAARARPRHPSRDPHRPRARRGAPGPGRPLAGARGSRRASDPGCRRPTRRRPTSWPPRRSPTSPSTPGPRAPPCACGRRRTPSPSRSPTTARAAPTPARAPGSRACATASRRWTAGSG